MITIASFGNDRVQTPEPEWFRAERYDYCERIIREHRQRRHDLLSKLFKKIHIK